jgi:hypothetical protein
LVVLTKANHFAWLGRFWPSQLGDLASMAYDLLPRTRFKEVTAKLADAIAARLVRGVPKLK